MKAQRGGEYMYSYNLPLNSALDGGGWSAVRPGRFNHGKEIRYPLYRRLGWTQDRSGRVRKISDRPAVASRYTDYAIAAHSRNKCTKNKVKEPEW